MGSATQSSTGFTMTLTQTTGQNLYPGSIGAGSITAQDVGTLTVQNVNAAGSSAKFSLTMPTTFRPVVSGLQSLARTTN